MILKSAFKQLRKNPFMNTLIVIQLAAVLTIICMLVSMIESRTEYYRPFAEEFSSEGYLCDFGYLSEDYITEALGNAKCEFTYWSYFTVNGQPDDSDEVPDTVIYSDKWINAYTPQMQSGTWLNDLPDDEYIHAVVTPDNPLGLTTGDIFDLSDIDGNTEKAVVCGVTENKQYAVGYTKFSQTDLSNRYNFFDMYYTYNSEVETTWGIYLAKDELDKTALGNRTGVNGMGFVLCDGLSDSEKEEIKNTLQGELATMYTVPLETIREGSFDYIKEQLYVLLPIALCIFVLTLITTISVVSISVNSQLRTYVVFCICGARWRDCSMISVIYSLIVCLISGGISLGAIAFITNKTKTVISLGLYEVLAMQLILVIFLLLSAIIPLTIMHGNQPKDILRKE